MLQLYTPLMVLKWTIWKILMSIFIPTSAPTPKLLETVLTGEIIVAIVAEKSCNALVVNSPVASLLIIILLVNSDKL